MALALSRRLLRSKPTTLAAAAWNSGADVLGGQGRSLLSAAVVATGGRQQGGIGWDGRWVGCPGWSAVLHSSAVARAGENDDSYVAAAGDSSSAGPAAAGGSAAALEFTPDVSALGGSLIGLAAATKLGFTGRILGVSGIVGGLVRGDWSSWRFSWLGGLAAGAVGMAALHPEGFYSWPQTYSMGRAVAGGLLVGLGTSLGSGCTSGHGVCGIARLAPRSIIATCTFMASGIATAALTGSLAGTGVEAAAPTALALMSSSQWQAALPLVGTSLAAVAGLRGLALAGASKAAGHAAEFASGAIFAAGLALSGMCLPSKVVGFLSPLMPAWDPSLAFVMGGALAVTVPTFQYMLRRGSGPLCSTAFSLPTIKYIDRPLLAGSAMFGAGWAIAGVCPGPALVAAIGSHTPQSLAVVAAMVSGMALHKHLTPLYERLLGSHQSQAACGLQSHEAGCAAWEQAEEKSAQGGVRNG